MMSKPDAFFPVPVTQAANVTRAVELFEARKLDETVTYTRTELERVEKTVALKLKKPDGIADSPSEQFRDLTLLLTNALVALARWSDAKEVLGRYRVRFPQDAWGFAAGAQVTRADPRVKDQAAVQRAIELLEGEAKRLEAIK
ncbi:MAG TPA: hypothetical protein VIX58_11425 [Anaerolineae bacterium]